MGAESQSGSMKTVLEMDGGFGCPEQTVLQNRLIEEELDDRAGKETATVGWFEDKRNKGIYDRKL